MFRRGRSLPIELSDLRGSRSSCTQSLTLGNDLAHQTNLLCLGSVETPASEQKIAYHGIADIALQARDSTESWDQAQPQFGKSKTGGLVRNNQVACQGEFKAPTKSYTVNRSDCGRGSGIDHIERAVNAFQKFAHASGSLFFLHGLGTFVELTQISSGAETTLQIAVDNDRVRGLL